MGIVAIYLGAYAVAYSWRNPAANLSYFVYAEKAVVDRVLFLTFLPSYRVHGLQLSRTKHLSDRTIQPISTGP